MVKTLHLVHFLNFKINFFPGNLAVTKTSHGFLEIYQNLEKLMIEFQENTQIDIWVDRPYFIGTFPLLRGFKKAIMT